MIAAGILASRNCRASDFIVCDQFLIDRTQSSSNLQPDPNIAFYLLQTLSPEAESPEPKFLWYVVYESGQTLVFLSSWNQMTAYSMPQSERRAYTGQIVSAMIGEGEDFESVYGAYDPKATVPDHFGIFFAGEPNLDRAPYATFRSGEIESGQYASRSNCRNLSKEEYESFVHTLNGSSESQSDLTGEIPPPPSGLNRIGTDSPSSVTLFEELRDALREANITEENFKSALRSSTFALVTLAIIRSLTVRRGIVVFAIPPVTAIPNSVLDTLTRSEWNQIEKFMDQSPQEREKLLETNPQLKQTLLRLIESLRVNRWFNTPEIA